MVFDFGVFDGGDGYDTLNLSHLTTALRINLINRVVPAEALPPKLRWLTLTDNGPGFGPELLGERGSIEDAQAICQRHHDQPRPSAA